MNRFIKLFSRLGAALVLIIIAWGCAGVPALREGSESNIVRLPFVRVLLDNRTDELQITGKSAFSLEGIRGGTSYVYYCSHPITIKATSGMITVWMNRTKIGDKFNEIILSPRGNSGYLGYKGKYYRGMFRVLPHGQNIQLINIVHMDDYLKGVVPPEIGFSGKEELEAIKAQAVAARTYAMVHLSQYKNEEYDMKSDISDQVYLGMEVEKDNVNEAIDATRGYVIKCDASLINAYYHSTCGGYTDHIAEVWDKPEQAYLRAVSDSGYCSWSKYYTWKESYTGEQLKFIIEQYLSAERGRQIDIGRLTDMHVRLKTAGGRVAELVVMTDKTTYTFGKDKIRWIIKRASNPELILQSARFTVQLERDSNGYVKRADLLGGGYGHGVGMCQCGAVGMARKGWKFMDILSLYYKNTEIVKMY